MMVIPTEDPVKTAAAPERLLAGQQRRGPSGRRHACWFTWRAELIPASPHPFASDRPLRPVKGPVAAIESLRP